MSWSGYFEFDGNEVINVDRVEAYADRMPWFKPRYHNGNLAEMLGHGERYTTPLLDDAPWVDPNRLESLDFYGYYPLSVTGLEDSTRTSSPVESIGDGGLPGRLRNATKTVVFSGVLVAATEAAAEYGMTWLREALTGGACGARVTDTGLGGQVCYLSSEPEMEALDRGPSVQSAILDGGSFVPTGVVTNSTLDGGTAGNPNLDTVDGGTGANGPIDALDDGGSAGLTGSTNQPVTRSLFALSPVLDAGGPSTLGDMEFDGGGVHFEVPLVPDPTFPFVFLQNEAEDDNPIDCLDPYRRSLNQVLVNTGPSVTAKNATTDGGQAWVVDFTALAGNPAEIGAEVPVVVGLFDPQVIVPWAGGVVPPDGSIDLDGFIFDEADCVKQASEPLYDPLWPLATAPPSVPTVPLGNYTPPVNWRRRQFTIPKTYVPAWGEVVPKVQVHARGGDVRTLRLRFYDDPFVIGDISDDPCAYCGDIVISYVPQDHTLVFDGAAERVYVITPGGVERSAEALVYATDGRPFEWPALSCGYGYVVTLDLPQTQASPVVDLSLYPRSVA